MDSLGSAGGSLLVYITEILCHEGEAEPNLGKPKLNGHHLKSRSVGVGCHLTNSSQAGQK